MPIREWPESTRPRGRLVARGASSLSDEELVALLVGSGTRQRSALLIANEVLRAIGGHALRRSGRGPRRRAVR